MPLLQPPRLGSCLHLQKCWSSRTVMASDVRGSPQSTNFHHYPHLSGWWPDSKTLYCSPLPKEKGAGLGRHWGLPWSCSVLPFQSLTSCTGQDTLLLVPLACVSPDSSQDSLCPFLPLDPAHITLSQLQSVKPSLPHLFSSELRPSTGVYHACWPFHCKRGFKFNEDKGHTVAFLVSLLCARHSDGPILQLR